MKIKSQKITFMKAQYQRLIIPEIEEKPRLVDKILRRKRKKRLNKRQIITFLIGFKIQTRIIQ